MTELTRDQKIQITNGRRHNLSRSIFELELDIIVMAAQGRTEDVELLRGRIAQFKDADSVLAELIQTL